MPAAEVEVDEPLVRRLLAEQFPDLAALPLVPFASGWDNEVFRLGEDLVVRLPRRAAASALAAGEQRWLPTLAIRLPLPVPVPLRAGRPSDAVGYPWAWSICRWLPGSVAGATPPNDLAAAARSLGAFLRALHQPAPPDAPENSYRGVPLADRSERLAKSIGDLGDAIDGDAVQTAWQHLVATPPWPGPRLWLHGDLHPANILVADGRISAVIDFGDLTSGDPACDLAVGWMLFPSPEVRAAFRSAAGDAAADDDTWARAQGWALAMAVTYLANSADHPLIAAIGARTLAAALPQEV